MSDSEELGRRVLARTAVEFFAKYGELSDNKNKKYKVPVEGKWVHFGDSRGIAIPVGE